jgi:hypothetical protein
VFLNAGKDAVTATEFPANFASGISETHSMELPHNQGCKPASDFYGKSRNLQIADG